MLRAFLSSDKIQETVIQLDGDEAHHLIRVMRIEEGAEVECLDGKGTRVRTKAVAVSKQQLQLDVLSREHVAAPSPSVHLYMAVIRQEALDWVIEKATEIGAANITPVLTSHAVAKIKDADKKMRRWGKLTQAALKQCGNSWLPIIHPPCPFAQALEQADGGPGLWGDLEATRLLKTALDDMGSTDQLNIWIGPEGDFSDKEKKTLNDAGVRGVKLSDNVLRSETAAILSLSVAIHNQLC